MFGLRAAVIRPEAVHSRGADLRFRRLVRNLHAWEFEAAKLTDLVAGVAEVLAHLQADLVNLARFPGAARLADEI